MSESRADEKSACWHDGTWLEISRVLRDVCDRRRERASQTEKKNYAVILQ